MHVQSHAWSLATRIFAHPNAHSHHRTIAQSHNHIIAQVYCTHALHTCTAPCHGRTSYTSCTHTCTAFTHILHAQAHAKPDVQLYTRSLTVGTRTRIRQHIPTHARTHTCCHARMRAHTNARRGTCASLSSWHRRARPPHPVRADMCTYMCADMCTNMCADICMNMSADMCTGICMNM